MNKRKNFLKSERFHSGCVSRLLIYSLLSVVHILPVP